MCATAADHGGYTARAIDYTDHTDQEYTCPETSTLVDRASGAR